MKQNTDEKGSVRVLINVCYSPARRSISGKFVPFDGIEGIYWDKLRTLNNK